MPVPDPATMFAMLEAGNGLIQLAGVSKSVPGWENKSRPLVLFFNNLSTTKVKIHNWAHVSGKALKSISTEPFSNRFGGVAFLCEGDGTWGSGVSGTFQVTVGNSKKFVFFSNPFAGCAKIHFANTAEEADANANDGNPKETKVGRLTMYASKQMAGQSLGNSSAEGFSIQFK